MTVQTRNGIRYFPALDTDRDATGQEPPASAAGPPAEDSITNAASGSPAVSSWCSRPGSMADRTGALCAAPETARTIGHSTAPAHLLPLPGWTATTGWSTDVINNGYGRPEQASGAGEDAWPKTSGRTWWWTEGSVGAKAGFGGDDVPRSVVP
ncbi:hypothetical protein ACWCPJ_33755 [Streptomyces collinus]